MNPNSAQAPPTNILVVDDTLDNIRLLSALLAEQGYKVRKAITGQMALTAAQMLIPDLILLDINMPEMDGYTVCRHLKANPQTYEIPVIFISALDDALDKVNAFAVGGVDYITKPFQAEEVIARIENQLLIQRQRHTLHEYTLQLEQEIKARQQAEAEIRLLLTTDQLISNTPDFDQALQVLLQQICEISNWAYGEAWIPTADHSALSCSPCWYGQSTSLDQIAIAQIEQFRKYTEVLTFYPGEEIPGNVWLTQKAQDFEDSNLIEDSLLRLELAEDCGLQAVLGVPIIAKNHEQVISENQNSYLLSSQSPVLAVLVFFTRFASTKDQRSKDFAKIVVSQSSNILQQKKVQAEMKALFTAMTDVITIRDVSGRCLNVVPTQTKNLYKPVPEMVGKKLHDVFPTQQADIILQGILDTVSEQKTVEVEFNLLIHNREVWFSQTISPLSPETAILVSRDITNRKQIEEALRLEQEKSEQLLLNILPAAIATQLKENSGAIAQQFNEVTILFADLVGFTSLSERLQPLDLVNLLNQIFSVFDELAQKLGLEKIKTIGDAYMVAAGLPIPRIDHAEAIAKMALAMQKAITESGTLLGENLQLRIGINSGSVVAGVIGSNKFIYDLWGDAVNVASRMESLGLPGYIQVTETTYHYLKHRFKLEKRGLIPVKGKGEMETYWLLADLDPSEK